MDDLTVQYEQVTPVARPTPPNLDRIQSRLGDLAEAANRHEDQPTGASLRNWLAAAVACARDAEALLGYAHAADRWAADVAGDLESSERRRRALFADLQHIKSMAIVAQRVRIGGDPPPRPAV